MSEFVPEEGLRVEVAEGVATLWLERPSKRNAVTYAMWQGITEVCRRLADDPGVRVLVVRGVGDHFCAGADIGDMRSVAWSDYRATNVTADEALASFPKPTVAVITGSCIGGGTEIAVACDIRVADTTATFGITPAKLGIVYPLGATERVVRLIGGAATKHLLFSADLIGSERALRIGLVDELLEPERLAARVDELVATVAGSRSLLTQMASKQIVAAIERGDGSATAADAEWQARVEASPEPAEGQAAFLERRPPAFTWRPGSTAGREASRDHRGLENL